MPSGAHDHATDPRNDEILIWVNGELKPRAEAVVSVFDSGFVLGDGVWEGLRIHDGHPAFLEQHLDRLWEGAAALMIDLGVTREELTRAVYDTLDANAMTDGVHVRLMCTRGVKSTPYQDPRVTVGPATIVIIAEHKLPTPETVEQGLALFTTHVRRATPDTLDPKLNAHSKLNDILACIQAYQAGADEALMLDPHGFVATCNSTHFFVVKGTPDEPEVWTSDGRFCLGGITRGNVLAMCRAHGITAHERTFSLTDVYSAQEAFVTGTFAGRRAGALGRRADHRVGCARSRRDPAAGAVRRLGGAPTSPGGAGRDRVRVAMWSGPRNISTAMMRAWENRPDTVVVDEPLYAEYLARTGLDHPGRDEVLAAQPTVARRGGGRAVRPAAARRDGPLRQAHGAPPRPLGRRVVDRRVPQRAADPRPGARWSRPTSAPARPASPRTSGCSRSSGCSTAGTRPGSTCR